MEPFMPCRGKRRRPAGPGKKACIGVIRPPTNTVYRSHWIGVSSVCQGVLGFALLGIYAILYTDRFWGCSWMLEHVTSGKEHLFVGGIVVAALQILAIGVTMFVIEDANYCWLHLALTLHVIGICGQTVLVVFILPLIWSNIPIVIETLPSNLTVNPIDENGNCAYQWYFLGATIGIAAVSVAIGSFLGTAIGYGVWIGISPKVIDDEDKKIKSKEKTHWETLSARVHQHQQKLVQLKASQQASSANENLKEDKEFTSMEQYTRAKDDSVIFVNRHTEGEAADAANNNPHVDGGDINVIVDSETNNVDVVPAPLPPLPSPISP